MNWLPFASKIFWRSWANRSIAVSLGCFAGFTAISAFSADSLTFVPVIVITGTKYVFATGGFLSGVAAAFLRVAVQNFGTDDSGNQIVAAIGTAPHGSDPRPAVVVAVADPKVQTAPTTTPETVKAAANP